MKILNVGILAHVDAGKTSLAERILYDLKIVRSLGNIERKDTTLDSMTVEKERGITVKNTYISFKYKDTKINLIDTPGHFDFIDEVESIFDVLDTVVLVISGLDGVQSQTKKIWNLVKEYNLPCIIYVNKIDILLEDIHKVDESIEKFLTEDFIRVNPDELHNSSDYLLDDLFKLIDGNPDLEDKLLMEESIDNSILDNILVESMNDKSLYPLIYGSAHKGIGIQLLLDVLDKVYPISYEKKLSLYVYKIEYTKQFGKSAYVKVFGGKLTARDNIEFTSIDGEVKEGQVSLINQNIDGKITTVDYIKSGDIGIIHGIADLKVGDRSGDYKPKKHNRTPSLYLLTIKEDDGKVIELKEAVHRLSEEYPALSYEFFEETDEIQIQVIGKMQGDIVYDQLKNIYGLNITMSKPRIIYKETPSISSIGYEAYTMPKPSWAVLEFEIKPLENKEKIIYKNQVDNDKLLPRYHGQIEDAIYSTLKQGRLGWEVTGLEIKLVDGESHTMHTSPLDFSLATPIAIQDGLDKAEMILLEPMIVFNIKVDMEYSSQVLSDVFSMEGEIINEDYSNKLAKIKALAPLSQSTNYITDFYKTTKGNGSIEQEFHSYQPCPKHRYEINKRKGLDPLNRDKWILYKRGAFGYDLD